MISEVWLEGGAVARTAGKCNSVLTALAVSCRACGLLREGKRPEYLVGLTGPHGPPDGSIFCLLGELPAAAPRGKLSRASLTRSAGWPEPKDLAPSLSLTSQCRTEGHAGKPNLLTSSNLSLTMI